MYAQWLVPLCVALWKQFCREIRQNGTNQSADWSPTGCAIYTLDHHKHPQNTVTITFIRDL